MALARLALKDLQKRVVSPLYSFSSQHATFCLSHKQSWSSKFLRALSTASEEKSQPREVSVAEGGKKPKLSPRRRTRRALWRNNRDFVPALWEFFPSGLGNAIIQATENINRVLENLPPVMRIKEQDECYKVRVEVPGLSKEDLKITVEDGMLTIKGEHKEEEEHGSESDDESWSSRNYGYFDSSVILPEYAKVDGITAEMKHGVLNITIPKTTERPKKDVKEIQVN
ncbi:unnamed protein product [Fraxinus pennsylvanica]|uniref:SHSP domain-containing protein n=1 Tax=Fraxinus pennsylvanica TaxID=56036 RepID=A0AAD2DSY8_9LAMI|nr:unnamed protein product [Fraxinus pennsylvanica]